MRYGAAVIVQVVWALCVRIVRTAVDRKISSVVDRDLILIEVLVLGEVRSTIELDPGRIRTPPIPHHEMPDAGKITLARQLIFAGQSWIARRHLRIVPHKLQHGQHPLLDRKSVVAQKPGAVGVLEAIYHIAQQSRVARIENRILIVTLARWRAVGKEL